MPFIRPQGAVLLKRLSGPRHFMQVVAGPRQVGKSTLVRQVLDELALEAHEASADDPDAQNTAWIARQWDTVRLLAARDTRKGAVLVIDEVQKVPRWSDAVKARWDEDTRKGVKLKVVLLGSSPLMMQQGLQESLAGRFELVACSNGRSRRCAPPSAGTWTGTSSMAAIPARPGWCATSPVGAPTCATRSSRRASRATCCR